MTSLYPVFYRSSGDMALGDIIRLSPDGIAIPAFPSPRSGDTTVILIIIIRLSWA